jgi:hypothetical protein
VRRGGARTARAAGSKQLQRRHARSASFPLLVCVTGMAAASVEKSPERPVLTVAQVYTLARCGRPQPRREQRKLAPGRRGHCATTVPERTEQGGLVRSSKETRNLVRPGQMLVTGDARGNLIRKRSAGATGGHDRDDVAGGTGQPVGRWPGRVPSAAPGGALRRPAARSRARSSGVRGVPAVAEPAQGVQRFSAGQGLASLHQLGSPLAGAGCATSRDTGADVSGCIPMYPRQLPDRRPSWSVRVSVHLGACRCMPCPVGSSPPSDTNHSALSWGYGYACSSSGTKLQVMSMGVQLASGH